MSALRTILLVDDEPDVLLALRRTLRPGGYRLLTTTTPYEVASILAREAVDLVLTDNDMPGMKGVELLAEIRRTHPTVVRMLITGRSTLESALEAVNRGEVLRYFEKPWEPDKLRAEIDGAMARLDELRRTATADHNAVRRQALLDELERDHPGILAVRRGPGGEYLLPE